MTCDIDALLEDARCFATLPLPILQVIQAQLLCNISTAPGASLDAYADNAAALAGGLTAGQYYRTGGDPDLVAVVH